jgi:hypothetical protein
MSNQVKYPLFVDLFYAVVIGSAFPLINLDQSIPIILYRVFLILVILEDWFAYYRAVLPKDPDQLKFDFGSLLFELFILLLWYMCVLALPSQTNGQPKNGVISLFFAAFYFFKLLAGLIYYTDKNALLRDLTYLIPIASIFVYFFFQDFNTIAISQFI